MKCDSVSKSADILILEIEDMSAEHQKPAGGSFIHYLKNIIKVFLKSVGRCFFSWDGRASKRMEMKRHYVNAIAGEQGQTVLVIHSFARLQRSQDDRRLLADSL